MIKTVKDRFYTFYLVLDRLPGDLSEGDSETHQERLYPLWNQAQKLIDDRQHALVRRTFTDEHRVEANRWEWCDQQGYVEVRGNQLAWPIVFYMNQEPEGEDIEALRALTIAAFEEVCGPAGVSVDYLHAEQAITYEVTEREIIP